jgi:membrane-associated phospholipid phosphatase
MKNDHHFELQYKFFDIVIKLTYFLTFISVLGISTYAPQYLETLNNFTRIYVCLFLIWRFNPIRDSRFNPLRASKAVFTNLDRKIAFNAGLLVLSTTIINKYMLELKDRVVEYIKTHFFNKSTY